MLYDLRENVRLSLFWKGYNYSVEPEQNFINKFYFETVSFIANKKIFPPIMRDLNSVGVLVWILTLFIYFFYFQKDYFIFLLS